MEVLKFGGTSVGTADRMNDVIDILEKKQGEQIVVLSAMSGTTNRLVAINEAIRTNHKDKAQQLVEELESKYTRVLTDLYVEKHDRDRGRTLLSSSFDLLRSKLKSSSFDGVDEKEVLAQGELISTRLFTLICEIRQVAVALIPALDFMRTNKEGEPDLALTSELIRPWLETLDDDIQILITQGYICRNHKDEVDNLQRGGSDYTATIIGAAIDADEVQIWTDIDGVHNNDPRLVSNTQPIRNLSYREAAELAYFGAKILHPTCVLPVEKANVPLRLKCTMDPPAPGTLISTKTSNKAITALAAKDGITAIKIQSHRMLNAYGFLTQVFQVFENHKTSVDMITTSEVAVSLTIDNTHQLDAILADLREFAEVEAAEGYTIICIVGNALYDESEHVDKIFTALKKIPVRMVSMGGSKYNVSLLVKSSHKKEALIALNSLFAEAPEVILN